MNYSWEVIKIVIYLALVLGLIYLIAYFMKNRMMTQNGRYIRVLERVYISPKISLSLIEAKDKVLLISVANDNVKLLESWSADEFVEIEAQDGKISKNFKEYIQEFINKPTSYFNGRDDNDQK